MTITFLVSGVLSNPSGGYKVIFEYANRFAADGYVVNIVMGLTSVKLKTTLAAFVRYPLYKLKNNYLPNNWFNLDENIKCYFNFSLVEKNIPESDVIIATASSTSFFLNKYKKNCKKIYFIQGYEDWCVGEKRLIESYKFDLKKIVIANWLKQKIISKDGCENSSIVEIPNGFDFSYFNLRNEISKRNKFTILMMYSPMPVKRCQDSFEALKIVKNKYPNLEIKMFGAYESPVNLPFDFEYFKSPNKELHNKLYNSSAIYIAASSVEGWGLTIGEAMICGCAVACTDNDGFKIMAHNEETALLSPVYDYAKLADNILRLIENDDLRIRIASEGNKYIQSYTWDNSYQLFKNTVIN